jgi:HEAT repeat-containing protein 5
MLQTAKIAANCIRSLLLQSPKTPADQSIARYLIPRLISFVTSTDTEDPEKARGLIAHALTTFVTTLKQPQLSAGMSLVLPTLLSRANGEESPGEVYPETSARLLELAGADQVAFREVVVGMTETQKAFMEGVIKAGRVRGAGQQRSEDGEDKEPTIALRMNFGGS